MSENQIFEGFFFIRKADKLSDNINQSVKNSLLVDKNYTSISISPTRKLNTAEIKKFHHIFHLKNANDDNVLIDDHKFRINYTLYTVQVYINKNEEVLALDQPRKTYDNISKK